MRPESSQWAWCLGYFLFFYYYAFAATAHPAAPALPVAIHRRHHVIDTGSESSGHRSLHGHLKAEVYLY
jgi:hypothetical protein